MYMPYPIRPSGGIVSAGRPGIWVQLDTAPELPRDGTAAELRRSAAFTPLQRGQTKSRDLFYHPVIAPVEAT